MTNMNMSLPAGLTNYGGDIDTQQFARIPANLKPILLAADMKRLNRRFEDLGWYSAPFVNFESDGSTSDSGLKAIFKNQNFKAEADKSVLQKQFESIANLNRKAIAALHYELHLPKAFPFIPNEFVERLTKSCGYKVRYTYGSHHGRAQYWELITDKVETIKNSHVPNDDVQLGCIVRNSINGGVALGADIFTYRQYCSNGAVARGKDLGSIAIRHIGDEQKMIDAFKAGIDSIIEATKMIVMYYKQAATIKINENMIEEFFKKARTPEKYLPKYIEYEKQKIEDPRTKKVAHVVKKVNVSSDAKGKVSLWEMFNDVTFPLWHNMKDTVDKKQTQKKSDKLGFYTMSGETRNLHKALVQVIQKVTH